MIDLIFMIYETMFHVKSDEKPAFNGQSTGGGVLWASSLSFVKSFVTSFHQNSMAFQRG